MNKGVQLANKHTKKMPASAEIVIRKVKIKTTMKYYYIH